MDKRHDVEILAVGVGIMAIPEPYSYYIGAALVVYAVVSFLSRSVARKNKPNFTLSGTEAIEHIKKSTAFGRAARDDWTIFICLLSGFIRGDVDVAVMSDYEIGSVSLRDGRLEFEGHEKIDDVYFQIRGGSRAVPLFDSGQLEAYFSTAQPRARIRRT